MLCFVSLWIDLLAGGMILDARDLVGLVNEHFPVYIERFAIFVTSFCWGISRLRLWPNPRRATPHGGGTTFGFEASA